MALWPGGSVCQSLLGVSEAQGDADSARQFELDQRRVPTARRGRNALAFGVVFFSRRRCTAPDAVLLGSAPAEERSRGCKRARGFVHRLEPNPDPTCPPLDRCLLDTIPPQILLYL